MIEEVQIGPLHIEDYQQLLYAMKASYLGWQGGFWSPTVIDNLITKFLEGQMAIKMSR